jgi:thioredoxin reductase
MQFDPKSIAGKFSAPAEHVQVAVIGAGPAGIAAAIAAAQAGRSVMLIDENPVSAGLIGLDVPLFFGGRATAAVQKRERMLEQVFNAEPKLAEAFELGVDVRLGTYVWGAFANGPNLAALPGPVLGLADEERSWMVGFDELIVATGARDLVFFWAGADGPGVMGAQALHSLLTRYDAFDGRRAVILGSGALALSTALLALDRGVEVAALIEPGAAPQGPGELVAAVAARGVPILTGHVPLEALGGAEGVERLRLATTGGPVEIACDTVCLAIDIVPVVELFAVLGCALAFDAARGGYVPVLDAAGRTSLPFVAAVGECGGLAEGDASRIAYRMAWMRALLETGGLAPLACQCEEVTRAEILGVRPPRYLGWTGSDPATPATLAGGEIAPDHIKRLTRAGMGPCQGRRCREQVALLLAVSGERPLETIPLASYRAPVRPLPLAVLQPEDEEAAMVANWDVWFGIPGQWVPYRIIGTPEEQAETEDNWHL